MKCKGEESDEAFILFFAGVAQRVFALRNRLIIDFSKNGQQLCCLPRRESSSSDSEKSDEAFILFFAGVAQR